MTACREKLITITAHPNACGIWSTDTHAKKRGRLFGVLLPFLFCWTRGFDASGKYVRHNTLRLWLYFRWWIGHFDIHFSDRLVRFFRPRKLTWSALMAALFACVVVGFGLLLLTGQVQP